MVVEAVKTCTFVYKFLWKIIKAHGAKPMEIILTKFPKL